MNIDILPAFVVAMDRNRIYQHARLKFKAYEVVEC